MPCYKPIGAVKGGDGIIRFHPSATGKELALPCGRCIGCRLEHSRQWALRCVHEARLYEENSWLTLTYDDEFLPYAGSLVPEHLQKFFKRLRKSLDGKVKVRYYACGEYGGTNTERPHYHVCLFGYDFPDRAYWRTGESGEDVDNSAELDRLWGMGECAIGELTFESAAYTARYCTKVITGEMKFEHYTKILECGTMVEIEPEFARMSRGLGRRHYERYRHEIFPSDECVINGKRSKPPRFYGKLLEAENPEMYADVKREREDHAESKKEDETLLRRTAREKVKYAQFAQLTRGLEK